MSHRVKALWLPGMTTLGCAASLLLGITRLAPAELWADPRAGVHRLIAGLGISAYVAFGALGAAWSRRVGGSL